MEMSMYKEKHFDVILQLYADAFSSPPLSYDFITPDKAERYIRSIINTPGFMGYTFWGADSINSEIVFPHDLNPIKAENPEKKMDDFCCDKRLAAFVFGVLDDYFDGVLYSISEFAVSPDLQRKGVGSTVLNMLESRLSANGVDAVNLNTSTHLPAYGFYKKNGYLEVTENVSFMKWLV